MRRDKQIELINDLVIVTVGALHDSHFEVTIFLCKACYMLFR